MEADVGALGEPAVELLLEVELARERAAGLEARLQRSPAAARPRPSTADPAASRKRQPTPTWPQNAAKMLGRAAAAGVQRALAVPDQRLRQPAQLE